MTTHTAKPVDFAQVGSRIGLRDEWHGGSVAEARQFVRELLKRWHVDAETAEDTVLVTSELVTNAFVHGAGPVWLAVERRKDAVVISVRDGAPAPVPREVTVGEESGRGLRIVSHLARSFGWNRYGHHKVVWAVLAPSGAE